LLSRVPLPVPLLERLTLVVRRPAAPGYRQQPHRPPKQRVHCHQWDRHERRNFNGLLMEIYSMEKCSHHLAELTDPSQYPLAEDKEAELRQWVQELSQVGMSPPPFLSQLGMEQHIAYMTPSFLVVRKQLQMLLS
ncbi:hypothetical protein Taro_023837, partial [Colocasia esculenta]|nr:hypothetical protein [Colocasia esculenta]